MLRQLLLLPLLAPLLAVMLVGALNPRPPVSLRLLIWSTPALPIGVWILLAAGGGGLRSAASTSLALRTGSAAAGVAPRGPRQVRRPLWEQEPAPPKDREAPTRAPWGPADGATAGPSRAPGEPAPTVAVPFRVIRRPSEPVAAGGVGGGNAGRSGTARDAAREDWGGDDWGSGGSDDW